MLKGSKEINGYCIFATVDKDRYHPKRPLAWLWYVESLITCLWRVCEKFVIGDQGWKYGDFSLNKLYRKGSLSVPFLKMRNTSYLENDATHVMVLLKY